MQRRLHLLQKDLADRESVSRQHHKDLSAAIAVLKEDNAGAAQQKLQVRSSVRSSEQYSNYNSNVATFC